MHSIFLLHIFRIHKMQYCQVAKSSSRGAPAVITPYGMLLAVVRLLQHFASTARGQVIRPERWQETQIIVLV